MIISYNNDIIQDIHGCGKPRCACNGMTIEDTKQLIAIAQPDGLFELDWQQNTSGADTANPDDSGEETAYLKYRANPDDFLLWLGLTASNEQLSESLSYLKTVSTLFVRKLSHSPDLELLREQMTVEPDEEEMVELLRGVP